MTETGSGADPHGSSPRETPLWDSSLSDSSPSKPSADQPNPFSREAAQAGDALGPQPSSAPSAGPEPFEPYPPYPSATGDPYAAPGTYPGFSGPEPYPAAEAPNTGAPPPGFDTQPTPPYGSGVSPYDAPVTPYGSNPYEYTPYQAAYGGPTPYAVVQVSHPKAASALVFGILGIVLGLSCGLGGLLGIAGIVQGRRARDEIDAQPGRYGGRSQAVAGVVTGIIGVVIAALVTLGIIALVVATVTTDY